MSIAGGSYGRDLQILSSFIVRLGKVYFRKIIKIFDSDCLVPTKTANRIIKINSHRGKK